MVVFRQKFVFFNTLGLRGLVSCLHTPEACVSVLKCMSMCPVFNEYLELPLVIAVWI